MIRAPVRLAADVGEREAQVDEPVAGKRGPYTLDVTYTLGPAEDGVSWQVTQAVYANQPPAFQP